MANYASLDAAISAGITNMTVLRNDTRNDDSTVAYTTGINWFKFNGNTVGTIYSSGNSWLGLGLSSEQIKVNRRDCAVWSEWQETGRISGHYFYRFRWHGTSYYNSSYHTNPKYQQSFEIFLFDTGQIYLNFYEVPITTGSGINALVCGNQTLSFSVTANTPCDYTFTPLDPSTGTGWSMVSGQPVFATYKPYGVTIFTINEISAISSYDTSEITWDADVPEGTTLTISVKINNGQYTELNNGDSLPISVGTDLSNSTLYLKIEMSTTDVSLTPAVNYVFLTVYDTSDYSRLGLIFAPGNQVGFRNAIGSINVSYDGTGDLEGAGGYVSAFSEDFTPTDLVQRPNQNEKEHVEITSITVVGDFLKITFQRVYDNEHLTISSIAATGTLIHVDDL